jgi:hypothetical protein
VKNSLDKVGARKKININTKRQERKKEKERIMGRNSEIDRKQQRKERKNSWALKTDNH